MSNVGRTQGFCQGGRAVVPAILAAFSVTLRCEQSEPRRATATRWAVADLDTKTTLISGLARNQLAMHPSRPAFGGHLRMTDHMGQMTRAGISPALAARRKKGG